MTKLHPPRSKGREHGANRALGFFVMGVLYLSVAGVANGQLGGRLEQASNGTPEAPLSAVDWVNTTITAQRGHYVEGSSIPYRLVFDTVLPGAHRIVIGWDTKTGGRRATDYLTYYNRLVPHNQFGAHNVPEMIQALRNVSGGPSGPTIFPIPSPAQPPASFQGLPPGQRAFNIYNGTITSAAYVAEGSLTEASAESRMVIDFTASDVPVVILFGGHLAAKEEYGSGQTAAGVGGLNYGMRVVEMDGLALATGSVAVNATAVVSPPTCDISGSDPVCPAVTNIYTASSDAANATFSWSLPANTSGAAIIGASVGPAVQVRSGDRGGSFTLQVAVTDGPLHSVCARTVTVRTNASITPLANASVCPGGIAVFSTVASGTGPFSYVWRKGETVLPGETKSELVLSNLSSAHAGLYCVDVSDRCGVVTSCATLTIFSNTTATGLPNLSRCVGDGAVFSTTAGGTGPFTYRWRKNGVELSGQTNRILMIPTLNLSDGGTYTVEVAGLCNSVTNSGQLAVHALPACGIQGAASICPQSTGNVFLAPPGMTEYRWRVMGNGGVVGVTNQQSVIVTGSMPGFLTLNLTTVNSNGCSRTCSRTITVGDLQPPVVTCPQNIQTNTEPGQCLRAVAFAVSASDDCDGVTVSCNPSSGTKFPKGATTVNCIATDSSGNQASCSFTVTVLDQENPVLSCPTNLVVNTAPGGCDAVATYTVAVSDNCPGASVMCSPPSGSIFPLGTSSVTCRGSDAAGNVAFCSFDVTVQDHEAPQITCPRDLLFLADPGQCDLLVDYEVEATDNCAMARIICTPASGSLFGVGQTMVECVAIDVNQNQNRCSFIVEVVDGEKPQISCPSDISVPCEPGRCDAVASFAATASDNCGEVTLSCVPPSGGRFSVGQTNVNCTAKDGSGNTASCTFKVWVSDNERPVLVCPGKMVLNTDAGRCDALVQYSPRVTDNCPGARVDCVPPSGSRLARGATTVNCYATDASSNVVSCAFNVTVQDGELPRVTCPEMILTNARPGECVAVVDYNLLPTDNCPGVEVYCDWPSGSPFPVGETWVYCLALDSSGNVQECTFPVTVIDLERPVITCPADLTINTQTGRCDAVATFAATATDNCGTSTVTCVPPSGSAFTKGTNTVNCTAQDVNGNTATCGFRVVVQDPEPPMIACPINIVANSEAGRCDAVVMFTATATDNCGATTVLCTPASGSRFAVGQTTVTCRATDSSGNTNGCSFSVTVQDVEPPVAICPANIVTNTEPGRCDAIVTFAASATDNCPGATVACTPPSGSRFARGTSSVTCTATDVSGNTATCAFSVRVNDNQPPVVSCTGNIVTNTASGRCDAVVAFVPTATDNCTPTTVACAPPSGATFIKGITTVICVATDGSGNTNQCSFTVTVQDREAPTVTCPANIITNSQIARCDAVVNFATVGNDNCPGTTVICSPASGSRFAVGQTTVSCVASDASGNTNRCTFFVTVNDVERPEVICPADITAMTEPGRCDAQVSFAANALDNCPGATVVCVPPSGSRFSRGPTVVACTANDASGNAAACAFRVTVNDNQPPIVSCPANIVTNTSSGRCDAVVSYATTANDNCAGTSVVCTPPSGAAFAAGVTSVNCVATDAGGNTNRCTFTVTVQDHEKPVITCPAALEVFTATGSCDALATFAATATDNCGGASIACSPASGSRFAKGVSTVTCTASDVAGNFETCSFTVTVRDNEPPALSCPTNIVIGTETGRCDAVATFGPTVLDNCAGTTITCLPPTGTRFARGTTPVNCTALDASSNRVTCSFTLTVEDREDPTLVCPTTIITNTAAGRCDRVVEFATTVMDNCGAEVICEPPSGSTFPLGTNEVTCTATDGTGNRHTCRFLVVVLDSERPAITCPLDIIVNTEPGRCDAAVTFAANATDNCSVATLTCVPPSGNHFNKGLTTVTCTATDAAANTSTCSFRVTVNDAEPPGIICPQNLVLSTEPGLCVARPVFSAQVSDNCLGASVTCAPASGSDFPIGVTTVVCHATDASGNSRSCAFDVRVLDAEPPRLLCPGDLIPETEPGECTATVAYVVTGEDSCSLTNLTCMPPSGSLFNQGVTLVQCSAKDASGNESTCAFNVTVRDNERPTLLCPTNMVVSATSGRCDARVEFVASALDNCGSAMVVCTPPSGATFALGTTMVNCGAADAAGNTNQCSFTVRVIDSERPIVTCPTNMVVNCESNRCDAIVNFSASATDNCGTPLVSCTPSSGSRFSLGVTPVTCSSTDGGGNVGTCSFTVSVRDMQSPTVQCPANITNNALPGRCDAPVTFNVTATDNCGAVSASCLPPSGSYFLVGTTTVACSATDGNANVGTCQFTVTIRDVEPPGLQCPSDMVLNTAPGRCDAVAVFSTQGFDNCSSVNVTCVPPSGSTFFKGTNYVMCTARDASSNSNSCTFRVVVRDVEKPQIVCPGDIVASTDVNECRTRVTFAPTATDNCTGITIACNPPSNSFFNKGVTTVICVATDSSGNTNRCSFTVTVNDTMRPNITCPANIVTNAPHGQRSVAVQFAPVVSDNCSGVSYLCTPQSGSVFQEGTTPVTCTATDGSGNTRSCSFMVTVDDIEPPVINCPTNLIVATSTGRCDAVALYTVSATDNSQMATVVCTPPSGSTLPKGVTSVFCTASDPATNQATCSFTISVVDLELPAITCPTNIVLSTESGRCEARVTYTTNATDNCGIASFTCSPPSGTLLPKGTNMVICTAADTSGNTNVCAFTVRVVDGERPLITCPGKMNFITPPGQCTTIVNFNPSVTDNCPGATVSCIPPSGADFGKGTTTVNCTARDASGNTSTCSFQVEVRDLESPVITCPADINMGSYPGACGAPVVYSATVRDNCPGTTLTCTPVSGTMMPVGTNVVICNAVDTSGNAAACSFRIVIRDVERPTITCPGDIVLDGSNGLCTSVVTFSPTVYDNCSGTGVNCVPPSGTSFPQGTTRVTCSAIDSAGNMASCAFSVINRLQPLAATPPQSQTHCAGETAVFAASATGSGQMTFAWFKDGVVMPGRTNVSLTLSNVTLADSGTYGVLVQTPCGTASNSTTLTVQSLVAVSGLTNVTKCDCDPLVLSPSVSGSGPYSYVWRKNGSIIPGAISNTLVFSKLSTNDGGIYSVDVSGACNTASASANIGVIHVVNPAVYTNSGTIAIYDNAPAFPYPSSIRVTCVPETVKRATVTLRGFTHSYPDDVDVMLATPDGHCVLLMSDAGSGNLANNINITLDDSAAVALPDSTQLFTGTFRPANYDTDSDTFPAPAPKLPPANGFAALAGTDPNGFWSLFVVDDFQLDSGSINNGWVLRLYWESNPVRITGARLRPDGAFQMTLIGDPQTAYTIEASSDLRTWSAIGSVTLTAPQSDFLDPNATSPRFYRAVRR